MRPTERDLMVARAVQAEYLRSWVPPEYREAAGSLVLESVIEAIPEPTGDEEP